MARRRSSFYDDYWPRYESSRPIRVRDGLKAKSQRGKFVENWWADRWIAALTQLMDPGRLSRGRSYARQGQVLEIDVQAGQVSARVQGSRRTPYRVSIELRPLSEGQWETVFNALAEQALYAAQLLNGEMPVEIEQVFDAVQVPLFPVSSGDLETDCTCPDWANPCKHIAAVYYLLGERFDGDPFLLLALRGRGKGEVIAALRQRRAQSAGFGDGQEGSTLSEAGTPYMTEAVQVSALDACLDSYWALGAAAAEVELDITAPKVDLALLKRLGMPDYLDARSFRTQMERVCSGVTQTALDKAYGSRRDSGAGPAGKEEQLAVLTMVDEGRISVEEAVMLLNTLSRTDRLGQTP
jgi:uncharacterized Zn finger protein